MDFFQEILWDLGEIIELPLHVDKQHACTILFDEKLPIQIEMDPYGNTLIIAAFVSELPPGSFRELVLKESLKANASYHSFGTFAYVEKNNMLVLHQFLLAKDLNGQKLAEFLELFIEEALLWQEAIASGQAAPRLYLKPQISSLSPLNLPSI